MMSGVALEGTPGISPTIARLTAIWERVLQQSPIEIDDNFFDCGGDSLLAIHVFMEIMKETGRELPITTIYDAPTVAMLGALLDGGATAPFSPLVLAKPGSGAPPFFLVHGMGGAVMQLTQLGKLIDYEGPVYAIQARGLDGVEPPIDNVDAMAAYYLRAISEIQPHGPYLLAGYSFGGVVAFTMAQRLTEAGETVALLGFLDSYAAPFTWPLTIRLGVRLRRARHRLGWLLKAPLGEKLAFIRFRLSGRDGRDERSFSHVRRWLSPENLTVPPSMQAVQDGLIEALAKCRPSFYSGKITFIRAAKASHNFPRNPRAVWGRHTAEIEVQSAPGDHLGLIEGPYTAELANVLSRCVKMALSGLSDAEHS
jgi:acetoacetyl-CoA synthetase